jgi:hypothetical protein
MIFQHPVRLRRRASFLGELPSIFLRQMKVDAYLRQMFSMFLSLHRRFRIIRLEIKRKKTILPEKGLIFNHNMA